MTIYLGYASPLQQRCVSALHAELSAAHASRKKGSTVGTMIIHVTLHQLCYMSTAAEVCECFAC